MHLRRLTPVTCATQITVVGQTDTPTIKQYLQDNFNYKYSFIGPVIGILIGFTIFFGGLAIGAPRRADTNTGCGPDGDIVHLQDPCARQYLPYRSSPTVLLSIHPSATHHNQWHDSIWALVQKRRLQ